MGGSHQHDHHGHGDASARRLAVVTVINAAGFGAELAGGLLFGSLALLSDAVHMLFDALAYATAFAAAYVAERMEGSERWTYGFHRLEVFSALINGLLLIPMAGFIVWEAYQRVLAPVEIQVVPTLLIALFGLGVNLGSVLYLRTGDTMSLNERGAFYHLLGDTGGSVAVVVGVVVMAFTGFTAIDPFVAAFIALFVVASAVRVILEGAGILLQRSPVSPDELKEVVEALDGVTDAHDIRAWRVCSSVNVCTLHVGLTVETLEEAERVRQRVEEELKQAFDLQHVTLQIEQHTEPD